MAYAVSRRTREIGIRMAIGASQSQVLGLIGRRALFLIGSGTAIGLALALAVGRLLEQILYGIQPTDPVTYATVLLMILAIAAVACCIPRHARHPHQPGNCPSTGVAFSGLPHLAIGLLNFPI